MELYLLFIELKFIFIPLTIPLILTIIYFLYDNYSKLYDYMIKFIVDNIYKLTTIKLNRKIARGAIIG